MLDVIEESRQCAMQRREAAVDHMATVALQAIVEGRDVREVARRCGFAKMAEKVAPAEVPAEMSGGLLFSWGTERPEKGPDERFADWLAQAVKKLVMEGLA
jgi:hypothetical protein